MDITEMRRRVAAKIDAGHQSWYRIQASADEAEIWIYDEISWWGVSAASFVEELRQVTAPKIVVHINSPGGDVFDGVAIMSALRAHPSFVTTKAEGLAASATSIIFQGGDRRVMVQHAQLMIHEAWGVAVGPASEIREFADLLDKQNDVLAGIYAERADGDPDHFRELMSAETWLTDAEAVELGLADEVFVPPRQEPPAARVPGAPVADGTRLVQVGTWSGAVTEGSPLAPTVTLTFDPAPAQAALSDLAADLAVGTEPAPDAGSPAGGSPVPEDAAERLLAAISLKEGNHDE